MALLDVPGMRPVLLGDLAVEAERRPDGVVILRSPYRLAESARSVTDRLEHWASEAPDRIFLADRFEGNWRTVTYAQALEKVRAIGEYMLAHGLSAERPLVILSGNGIEHGRMPLERFLEFKRRDRLARGNGRPATGLRRLSRVGTAAVVHLP